MNVDNAVNAVKNKSFILLAEHEIFLTYLRTKQVFSLRYRGLNDKIQPVHVSTKEIESRFFPYPKFRRKDEIAQLVDNGYLSLTIDEKRFLYSVLKSGNIDLSLLNINSLPSDTFYKVMVKNLQRVSLPKDAESTDYFNLFLRYKDTRAELFFKVDAFAGRIHTPISNYHRHLRPSILLDEMETTSLDVVTMQPLLLSKILDDSLPKEKTNSLVSNEYSQWINEGKDIYLMLKEKAGLVTRDEAKKKFFEILFSKPSKALSNLFGASDWIEWINEYKTKTEPKNPHGIDKSHSNLAWLLQTTEVKVMIKIWKRLISENIIFLSVHDEIIIKKTDVEKTYQIMSEVLASEFKYFRIEGKKNVLFPSTLSTLSTLDNEETALKPPKSKLPAELIALQKEYRSLVQAGNIGEQHRDKVIQLWENVKNSLKNKQIGLTEAINELIKYKQFIVK